MSNVIHYDFGARATRAHFCSQSIEVGDDVILDTGEAAVVVSIFRDFAWVFIDREGFESVELRELRRPDPSHRSHR